MPRVRMVLGWADLRHEGEGEVVSDEIKACPFCGSTASVDGEPDREGLPWFVVACDNLMHCNTQTDKCISPLIAKSRWNTRADDRLARAMVLLREARNTGALPTRIITEIDALIKENA